MANAVFGYNNLLEQGTLSSGSEVSGLNVSNLKIAQGSSAASWQTTSGVVTSANGAWFLLDMGYTATFQAFCLTRTTLTPSANIRWRVGSSSAFSAGTVAYDTGTVGAGVLAGYGQSVTFSSQPKSGRYVRCDIDDPTNGDGFLAVGLAYCGPVWQPTINMSWDSSTGADAKLDEVVTRGGQEYPQFRYEQRRWDVSFQQLAETDMWAYAGEVSRIGRRGGNVLFIPDPASANLTREAVYGRPSSLADFSYTEGQTAYRTWKVRVTERL